MAKIGFLGIGEMGTPMASRLLKAGHDVVVWNRGVERTAPLAKEGAAVAASPAKAAAGTIRKTHALSIGENSVHGSDAADTAAKEIAQFFSGNEIVG